MRAFLLAGLISILPSVVQAEDKALPLRERINCFPAKDIAKFVSKFQGLSAEKRDTVDMIFAASFKVTDGGPLPERIFIRDNGVENNLTLTLDGNVPDFDKVGSVSKKAELCSEDSSRIGTPRSEGINFSIMSDVHFLDNTGYHDIASLEEGLKDGKSHYKKMLPGPMSILVPRLTYVMIEYDAEKTPPQYRAVKGKDVVEGLTHIMFCETAMIKVEDIEALGADGLKVMGGPYNLTPVPGPKTLAKFVECSKDEEGENKEE